MKCKKCGKKLSASDGKLCFSCRYDIGEKVKTVATILCYVFGFIYFFSSLKGGPNSILLVSVSATIVCLSVLLIGIVEEHTPLIVVTSFTLIAYFLILLGATNDFPNVIRHIQGKDFIGILFKLTLISFIAFSILGFIVSFICSKIVVKKAKSKDFSESDLMMIQGFNRHKIVGYYLLKAKLHNVIKYEKKDCDIYIKINNDLTKEELKQYRINNPQANIIFSHLKKTRKKLSNVIKNVRVCLNGQTDGGSYIIQRAEKLKKIIPIVFCIFCCFIFSISLSKFLMGLNNGKSVTFLMIFQFIFVLLSIYLFRFIPSISEWVIKHLLIKRIVINKSYEVFNITPSSKSTSFEGDDMTQEEISRLLRSFIIYDHKKHEYKTSSKKMSDFSTAIITSVASAQVAAAALARQNSSGRCSGCSSCGSGCGGCGGCGSCGGCGGCGD